MIMTIEHGVMQITTDAIKTKLLDIEFDSEKTGNAFASRFNKVVTTEQKSGSGGSKRW